MSTSFGWRRKKRIRGDLQQEVAVAFEEADSEEEATEEFVDWLVAAKRRRGAMLEDAQAKSRRLREEGAMLAENERSLCVYSWCVVLSVVVCCVDTGKLLHDGTRPCN